MRLERQTRRSFAAAFWAASAWTLGTRNVSAQARAARFQPARHAQDVWLDVLPGKHRTIIDGSTVAGAGTALLYAYNLYAANKSDYALAERDVAVVVCLRHAGTAFGFNDVMWGKYGKTMNATMQLVDPNTKDTPKTNLFYSVDYGFALTNLGVTISSSKGPASRYARWRLVAWLAASPRRLAPTSRPYIRNWSRTRSPTAAWWPPAYWPLPGHRNMVTL